MSAENEDELCEEDVSLTSILHHFGKQDEKTMPLPMFLPLEGFERVARCLPERKIHGSGVAAAGAGLLAHLFPLRTAVPTNCSVGVFPFNAGVTTMVGMHFPKEEHILYLTFTSFQRCPIYAQHLKRDRPGSHVQVVRQEYWLPTVFLMEDEICPRYDLEESSGFTVLLPELLLSPAMMLEEPEQCKINEDRMILSGAHWKIYLRDGVIPKWELPAAARVVVTGPEPQPKILSMFASLFAESHDRRSFSMSSAQENQWVFMGLKLLCEAMNKHLLVVLSADDNHFHVILGEDGAWRSTPVVGRRKHSRALVEALFEAEVASLVAYETLCRKDIKRSYVIALQGDFVLSLQPKLLRCLQTSSQESPVWPSKETREDGFHKHSFA